MDTKDDEGEAMIVYAKFELSMHGLEVPRLEDLLLLKGKIEQLIRESFSVSTQGDVEMELIESAGDPN
jgi:hypothetical protein